MYPFITANVADEHLRDLLREAAQSRATAEARAPRRIRRRRPLSWRLSTARTATA